MVEHPLKLELPSGNALGAHWLLMGKPPSISMAPDDPTVKLAGPNISVFLLAHLFMSSKQWFMSKIKGGGGGGNE